MSHTNSTAAANSNKEFKSSTFTAYFSIPENAADLYRSLDHSENSKNITPEDIEFTTLEGVLYMARKNDLAFTARKKVLVIGEHQSTLNLNMPLRSAIYYGRTMERLITPRDIYKTRIIPIPTPEFYMFYNGTRIQPAERILKLSDSYLEMTDSPMLELKVKMININPSAMHPILKDSRCLYEYSTFIQKIRIRLTEGETRGHAIEYAMKDCLSEGIMTDFIHAHGSEVINMIFTEFNMEDALEVREEEQFAEGKAAGISEGKAGEISIIRRKQSKGFSAKETADLLELDESYISCIFSLCDHHPDADDVQIASLYLNSCSDTTA